MRTRPVLFGCVLLVSLLTSLTLRLPAVAAYRDGTGSEAPLGLDAHRIVCLAPNVTEMLWYLGLGERQVGRSEFCDYPAEVKAVRSVGGFADTSLELVVALQPDLVVAYQGNSLDLVSQLRQLGITVLALEEARTLAEIGDQMEVLYLAASARGAQTPPALSEWRARLAGLRPHRGSKLRVFYGYPGEMSYTCGHGSFLDDLIGQAGGANAAAGQDARWPQVSAEFILAAQPDVLLTASSCSGGETLAAARRRLLRELARDKVWSALPAVKAKRIVILDSGVLLRPGPRILDALADLAGALAGWQ